MSSCPGLLPGLCLGVFTPSLSGQVWLGPLGWAPPPALSLGEGASRGVRAGCQVRCDGAQPRRLGCTQQASPARRS